MDWALNLMIFNKIIPQRLMPASARTPLAAGRRLARKIKWGKIQPGRPTVLAASRSQFSKDIEEMRHRTGLNWATLSAVKIKEPQQEWVAEADQQQSYFAAILRNGPAALQRQLTEFGVAFLTEASRRTQIDAVMAANVDYWQDESLRLACRELGIPFLVLCRENYTIPWTVPWLHERFADAAFKFDGAGVACFSEATKRAITPGMYDADDIWVTGAPRYDRWLDLKPLPAEQKNYLSLITFNMPGYGAQDVFKEVLEAFGAAAAQSQDPAINWLVKCKKRADMEDVRQQLPGNLGNRLQLSFNTQLFDLFPKSRLVIGYNSLALVEAMLADAPVVMPKWGQARPKKSDLLLDPDDPSIGAVIHTAETPQALTELMRRAAAGEDMRKGTPQQRREVFSRHLHIPATGNASAAVEKFVRHFIDRAQAQRGTATHHEV